MELRKDNRPILDFAKLGRVMPMPNLLDVQLRSIPIAIPTSSGILGSTVSFLRSSRSRT